MRFLAFDQHARQRTVSLRDQHGEVLLARQVSTRSPKTLKFFDQLSRPGTNIRGAPEEHRIEVEQSYAYGSRKNRPSARCRSCSLVLPFSLSAV